jgi:hypothetical protein
MSLKNIVKNELSFFFIFGNLALILCLIMGIIIQNYELVSNSKILIITNFVVSLFRVLVAKYCSLALLKTSK